MTSPPDEPTLRTESTEVPSLPESEPSLCWIGAVGGGPFNYVGSGGRNFRREQLMRLAPPLPSGSPQGGRSSGPRESSSAPLVSAEHWHQARARAPEGVVEELVGPKTPRAEPPAQAEAPALGGPRPSEVDGWGHLLAQRTQEEFVPRHGPSVGQPWLHKISVSSRSWSEVPNAGSASSPSSSSWAAAVAAASAASVGDAAAALRTASSPSDQKPRHDPQGVGAGPDSGDAGDEHLPTLRSLSRATVARLYCADASAASVGESGQTAQDGQAEGSVEDQEWEQRQQLTGASGRMVCYNKGEHPRNDVLFRGGGSRRIMVAAVTEDGKAQYVGIKAGDVLVSVNGSKDFQGKLANDVHASLCSPVILVFMGFVGKLQAEVRLNHRQKILGLSSTDPVFFGLPGSPAQLTDQIVFQPRKGPLILSGGSKGPSAGACSSSSASRGLFSDLSGMVAGHTLGDQSPPEMSDDSDDEVVVDIDELMVARGQNLQPVPTKQVDYAGVYELRSQDARRILDNVLVSSNLHGREELPIGRREAP